MRAAPKVALVAAAGLLMLNVIDSHLPSKPQQVWVVESTPYYKDHPLNRVLPQAVCITTTEPYETKIVAITAVQAYGDENGEGFLEKGALCPA